MEPKKDFQNEEWFKKVNKESPDKAEKFVELMKGQMEFKGESEHLYHLIQGVDHWNEWSKQKSKEIKSEDEKKIYFAYLEGVDFRKEKIIKTNLWDVEFENANLRSANLQNAILGKANLQNAILVFTNLQNANLGYAHLESADLNSAYLNNAELTEIYIDKKTDFTNTIFGSCILSLDKSCDEKKAIKALSKGLVNNIQFFDTVFGRKVRDESWLNDWRNNVENLKNQSNWEYYKMKFLERVWYHSSDYGRDIVKWIKWSIILAVIFGLIFWSISNQFTINSEIALNEEILSGTFSGKIFSVFKYMYYSIVTFTTLGFGDITPTTMLSMFFVMLEVVCGYIMLGGLISILANKLARRND